MAMTTYRFTCNYASGIGAWRKGDTAEFDAVTAAWLLRDAPGCIEPVASSSRVVDAPEHDRQMKAAPKKRSR
ncbi:MAG TPA: hypothetical protein VNZ58_03615 [Thermomicrobiales bacterium]|nr:hypothetical protein [Thermomicrobiales bacterium]